MYIVYLLLSIFTNGKGNRRVEVIKSLFLIDLMWITPYSLTEVRFEFLARATRHSPWDG